MMFPLNKVKILLLYFMVFVAGVFDARWFETHAYWMMGLLLAAVASGMLLMWDDLRDCGKSILSTHAAYITEPVVEIRYQLWCTSIFSAAC